MSKIRHYDPIKKEWVIDAANNANNIELTNPQFAKENSISVDEGFDKIGNRLTKLEQNLAWVYKNGAKGGGGSGTGGSSSSYTLEIKDNKSVFYSTGSSIDISMQINSGGVAKCFKLNVVDLETGQYLISGETHRSMQFFTTTVNNLPIS